MNCTIKIITAPANDQKALTKVQQKLNQWNTTGLLRKYKTEATGGYIVFQICLKKEA